MKTRVLIFAALTTAFCVFPGCRAAPPREEVGLYQFGPLAALMEGVYGGGMTIGELKTKGDLGLGTLDGLDGELVAVDGEFYQVKYDGTVVPVEDGHPVPFAAVTFFRPSVSSGPVGAGDFDRLVELLDDLRDTDNLPFAFRIDGSFEYVKARSVAAQREPYPPLARALQDQSIFEYYGLEGSAVGFWMPAYFEGINAPGYHLHFVCSARRRGGHLLDCRLESGWLAAAELERFVLVLPSGEGFLSADLEPSRRYDPRGTVVPLPADE